jgi:hypothetical protein
MPLETGLNQAHKLPHKDYDLHGVLPGYLAVDFLHRTNFINSKRAQKHFEEVRSTLFSERAKKILKFDCKLK